MEKNNINWLGWASFALLTIVAFNGIKIDVCHKGVRSDPVRFEVDSNSYSGLKVTHSGDVHVCPTSGIKFYVDVDNHHKNY